MNNNKTKKQAIHDADARDGYPHALWGDMGTDGNSTVRG